MHRHETEHCVWYWGKGYLHCRIYLGKISRAYTHIKKWFLFFTFLRIWSATLLQLSVAVAFWASVWSASLFPVQTESHRRKLCLPSWVRQSEPCEVSRPQRHMFGISASIRIEHSRYTLKEPSPHRTKQKCSRINMFHPMPRPAVWTHPNKLISTDLGKKKKKNEKQACCFSRG